jgi:hypothetical protein
MKTECYDLDEAREHFLTTRGESCICIDGDKQMECSTYIDAENFYNAVANEFFTDRFVELPFVTVDSDQRKAIGLHNGDINDLDQLIFKRKLDISSIEYYEQAIPETHTFALKNAIFTEVGTNGGHVFLVALPMEEFEAVINKHYTKT